MRYWQVNKQVLRVLRTIVWIALSFFLLFYVAPLLLFRIPAVQRAVAERVSTELSKLLDSPVELKRVNLLRWTDLEVEHLLLRDSLQRPILQAQRFVGGISLLDLLSEGEVHLSSVRLFDAQLDLIRDPRTQRLNVQHIIDHLTRPKQTDSQSMPVGINSIIVRDMRLSLLEEGRPDFRLDSVSVRVRRLRFAPSYIGGALDELSFSSNIGFRVDKLSAQMELRGQSLSVHNLQLALPNSELSIPSAQLDLGQRSLAMLQQVQIASSTLSVRDFSFWKSSWRERAERLLLSANYKRRTTTEGEGFLRAEVPSQLTLEQSFGLTLDQDAKLKQIRLQTGTLQVRSSLLDLLKPILSQSQSLPSALITRAASLRYEGALTYTVDSALSARGTLATAQGEFDYELQAGFAASRLKRLTGFVRTDRFRLGDLLDPKLQLGDVTGELTVDAEQKGNQIGDWRCNALAQLKRLGYGGYTYQGIQLSLEPQDPQHLLVLSVTDPNAQLQLKGKAALNETGLHAIAADLEVQQLHLDQLNLLPKFRESLALNASLQLDVMDLDKMQGLLTIPHILFTGTHASRKLEGLQLRFHGTPERGRLVRLSSPYLQAELSGNYRLAAIAGDVKRTLAHHLPALFPQQDQLQTTSSAAYELRLELRQLPQEWADYLRLPLGLDQGASVWASLEGDTQRLQCHAIFPQLRIAGNQLKGAQLNFDGHQLRLLSDLRLAKGFQLRGIELQSQLHRDSIYTVLDLGQDADGRANGHLGFGVRFGRTPSRQLQAMLRIDSSQLRVHSEAWRIAPAYLAWQPGLLQVEGLDLSTADRRVSVSGRLSEALEDKLSVALHRINLLYILESVGVGFNMLDADLTGSGTASMRSGIITATAQVASPAFHVKGVDVGALNTALSFSSTDGLIRLSGDVQQSEGGHTTVDGFIRPANGAGIDLNFQADRLRVDFISTFMDTLFERVQGRATGAVRLFGLFEDGVTVEGRADVQDGSLGVRLLGTRYLFDGPISFSPEQITFDKLPVRDDEGHTGRLDGYIKHRYFDHFELDLKADELRRMKVLQTQNKQALPFFGTAYGSGSASLKGALPRLQLGVNMVAQEGTEVTLDFNQTDVRKEDKLFTFKPLRPRSERDSLLYLPLPPPQGGEETEVNMQMNLRVTPAALLTLRLGSGEIPNEVKARCEGDLTIDVPHLGAPKTYGSLKLVEGSYVFNFEQLTRRRFVLREGGSLSFRGDPMAAEVNLTASYSLTANIADFDATLASEARRNTMPVNCILQLGGIITQPAINLGLELPGAEPEIERRIQSLLNTRDERNRQVLYLMTLGKFYTPENRRSTTSVSEGWASLASSTISEQLTHLLGSFSKDIQFGTNIRTSNSAFEDTDVELRFSGTWFNNRLSVNGNVGYHNNPFLQGKYIGEFDLEYKLNPEGTLRLKGYNRYNNMYQYLRQSLTTQGLGFMFQRQFDSFSELLMRKQPKKRTFVSDKEQVH